MSIEELIKLLKALNDVDNFKMQRDVEIHFSQFLKLQGTENSTADTKGMVFKNFGPLLQLGLDDYRKELKSILIVKLRQMADSLEEKIEEKVEERKPREVGPYEEP